MNFWKQICWLHQNLPAPALRAWSSSDTLVNLSRRMAFGMRHHENYARWLRLFKDMEKWSQDEIYEFQYDKLRNLLEHSYVPHKSYVHNPGTGRVQLDYRGIIITIVNGIKGS